MVDQERLFYLVSFIKGDIEGAFESAVKEACEKKVRHEAVLEPIAQEASLAINQVLLGAKREFGIGGLEAETPLDETTKDALAKEIEALDASYSLPTILELLAEELGIHFIREVKRRLEARLKEPMPSIEALQKALNTELESAYAHVQAAVSDPELLRIMEEDLGQIRVYYLDPDFLRARLISPP